MKLLISLMIVLSISVSSFSLAAEAELKRQTVCPVMGGEINKDVYLDYHGQRIYFCCPGCREPFLKEPNKYFETVSEDNVLLESVQEFCPVMEKHEIVCFIDKKVYTDYKGRRVYFCSQDCKNSFLKDPEEYLKRLNDMSSGSDPEKEDRGNKIQDQ